MRNILMVTALAASTMVADGNPIALPPGSYSQLRHLKLTEEKVVVKVGSSESSVTGDYTFQATDQPVKPAVQADMVSSLHRPGHADIAFVIIVIPVIVPFDGTTYGPQFDQWEAQGAPTATFGERVYTSIVGYPGDMPESVKVEDQLPVGWKLVPCTFNSMPFDTSKNEVKVHIYYNQPHLPGNISAYLPILPDNIVKTNYLITFQAQEGVRFAPIAHYEVVGQPTDTNLSVRPANFQLLKMQVTTPTAPPASVVSPANQTPLPATATKITSVAVSGSSSDYTLTINGTGFGSLPGGVPFNGVTPYFRLFEVAQLGAGEWGYPGDANPLAYQSWSDTQIQISGLAALPGDAIQIWVSNPTTGSSATWGGNLPGGSGNPHITSVIFSGSGANLQMKIKGFGFGAAPTTMPFTGNLNQFLFADQRTHSGAGAFEAGGQRWGHGRPDPVTVKFQSWSDNQIVINGFAGVYGQGDADTIQNGDPVYIVIWNASDTSQTELQTAWGGFVSANPADLVEPPSAPSPDLQEVARLSKPSMSDDVITSYIKSTGKTFKLSTNDILFLEGQGVSQGVINALVQTVPSVNANSPLNVTSSPPGSSTLEVNSPVVSPTPDVPSSVIMANNAFAFDLYSQLAKQPGNLFFSPYSIETALAMTWAGAEEQTADQMRKVLHLSGDASNIHAGFAGLIEDLNAGEQPTEDLLHGVSLKGVPYQLFVANSLWCQQGFPFKEDFLEIARDHYDASLNRVDFIKATEPARQQINDWVAKQTHEKIQEIIPSGGIDSSTRLVLADAIYFKGHWRVEFDKSQTQDAPFHPNARQTISVPTMKVKDKFQYCETKSLQILELPYFADKMSMIIVLPKEVDGLSKLEESLNAVRMDQLLAQMQPREVNVFLPKFKLTSQFSLAEALEAMGMPDAFAPKADFSGISSSEPLYISAVLHKAYVKVDEEGTEAVAATAVGVVSGVEPPPPPPAIFRADHPFLFLIRHNQTGVILFLGRVTSP